MSDFIKGRRRLGTLVAGAGLAAALAPFAGCAPLVLGGAIVGTGLVVSDRRTAGTQLEDEAIELKAVSRARDLLGERGHVNATSYNRMLLLTGEVASDADRTRLEAAAASIDNVRSIVNELAVMGASSMTARSNDAVLTSKVKARLVDAGDVHANLVKVVTERSVVYLMGLLTEREAARAAEVARSVAGVAKVVRVVEVISPEAAAR